MSAMDDAGAAMIAAYEGNRTIAAAVVAAFRRIGSGVTRDDTAFTGPDFSEQEPGLKLETARIPAF